MLFCWAFLLLVFTGHGAFGLDGLLARVSARRTAARGGAAEQRTPVTA
ncbi:hypothetical protein [Streptomyces naganishii]|uniref:Uncharacterized protein n=1 Tax=Streptomyces naganishii JCM 4654 TaxID=1306179 RepID=A0A918Y6M3_9ACTN|nr:hypothetical protein GCM10010508_46390 [Streptomyces naganishii JCM 4654]